LAGAYQGAVIDLAPVDLEFYPQDVGEEGLVQIIEIMRARTLPAKFPNDQIIDVFADVFLVVKRRMDPDPADLAGKSRVGRLYSVGRRVSGGHRQRKAAFHPATLLCM